MAYRLSKIAEHRGLAVGRIGGVNIKYREGTSDEAIIREVICRTCYRKKTIGFDVLPGEHWLDLGANIGAFAVYCTIKKAHATCYEPEPACYQLLVDNATPHRTVNAAVTARKYKRIIIYPSKREGVYAKASFMPSRDSVKEAEAITVPNVYAGTFGDYDGVKMDIEGAEFAIIDDGLIPKCRKLVMEYHTSKDPSSRNLWRRLEKLRTQFAHIYIPPELERLSHGPDDDSKPFYDRLIFCWNDK